MLTVAPFMIWMPTAVAAGALLIAWRSGEISGRHSLVLTGVLAGGLWLLLAAPSHLLWSIGLIAHVLIAIYLITILRA